MATREQLMSSLRKAHAAGDTEAARRIAGLVLAANVEPIPEPIRPRTVPAPDMGAGMGLAGGVAQGVGLNFVDEIVGQGRAALHGGSPEVNRRLFNQEYESAPLAARLSGEIGGSIALGSGLMSGAKVAAPKMAAGFQKLPAWLQGVLAGTAGGAGAGAGASDPGQRMSGAGWGGLLGGGLGGVIPGGIQAGRYLTRPLRKTPTEKAARIVQNVISDDFPEGAVRQAARMRQLGPHGMVADVGDNTRSLVRGAEARPGAAKRDIRTKLNKRDAKQEEQFVGITKQIMDPNDKGMTLEALRTRRSEQAKEAYGLAQSKVDEYTSPNIRRAVTRPWAKKYLNEWAGLTDYNIAPGDPVPFDGVQYVYSRVSEDARNAATVWARGGKSGSRANLLNQNKSIFLRDIAKENPAHADAVVRFAQDSDLMLAAQEGRKFGQTFNNPAGAKEYIKNLADAEREQFVGGIVEGVRDSLGQGLSGRTINNVLRKPYVRDVLKETLPGDAYNKFVREVTNAAEFRQTKNMLGGSPTSRIDEEKLLFQLGFGQEIVDDLRRGNAIGAASKVAGSLGKKILDRKLAGRSGETTAAVADMLMTGGKKGEDLIKRLPDLAAPKPLSPINYGPSSFAIGAESGGLLGNSNRR